MAEGLSPAENGPAPAVGETPSDPSAPRPSLYRVDVPPVGRRRFFPIYPQLFIRLSFDLALPAVGRRGDDMVLGFENGGEVVFEGFVGIAETHPTLHLLPPDGSLLPGDYVAEALTELGEAAALPSEDGLAAQTALPESAPTAPARSEPVVPDQPIPEPVAPEAFAVEAASPPVQPTASPTAPQIEPAAEPTPGPVPTRPRPSPLSEQPEPEFPVEAILQDLEAQGVVPASAPVPAEEAGSAAELVDQVATALPDFPAAADGAPLHPAADPPAIEPSDPELPEPETPAADSPPPQAWDPPETPVEPADRIIDAEPQAAAAPQVAPVEWDAEVSQAAVGSDGTRVEDAWARRAGLSETEVQEAGVQEAEVRNDMVLDDLIPDAGFQEAGFQQTEAPDAEVPEAEVLSAEDREAALGPEHDLSSLPDAAMEATMPLAAEAVPDLAVHEPPPPMACESEAVDLVEAPADLPPTVEAPEMIGAEAEIVGDPTWPDDASPEAVDLVEAPADLPPAVEAPEMIGAEAEIVGDPAWPDDASPEAPRDVASAAEVARADAPAEAEDPMAEPEVWPEAVGIEPAVAELQAAPVSPSAEPELPPAPEPAPAAPAEPVAEDRAEDFAEAWAGETAQAEAEAPQDPVSLEMPPPPEAEPTGVPLEPTPWPAPDPMDNLDPVAMEDTAVEEVRPVAEAPVPETSAPALPTDHVLAEPQAFEPVSAVEDEAAPAPAAIAVPDFAALASQAGLELPTAPPAAPTAEEAPPVELFESPDASPPQEAPEAEPEAPFEAAFEAPPRAPDEALDVPLPAPADPQPSGKGAEPLSTVPEIGTLADAPEETVPPEPAAETGSSAPGGGILRTAMASVLRAGNRILPSRGGEAEDVAAAITEAQEVVAAAKSVLDEEEVLELTQPAEMPLPAPPVTLPESAGTPLPPLEEGKPPAEDLDAIELFSDPLSYGAGVTESPAPIVEVRQPGAGRRLGSQEPLPTEVQDAVRLALHQMEGADLFEFDAEAEGAETAAAPAEGTFAENPAPTPDGGTG